MSYLLWRSLLFVPADRVDLLEKAPRCDPDAVILDLEDGVAAAHKQAALDVLAEKISFLRAQDIPALVRIDRAFAQKDFDKIAAAQPMALILPKIKQVAEISRLSAQIGSSMDLVVLVEHPRLLDNLFELAAMRSVVALALGSEDFSLAMNVMNAPSAALDLPCKMIALAARAYEIAGFGLPISVGAFGDLAAYRRAAEAARTFGLSGALCIHPAQVEIINQVFRPTAADVALAHQIIKAWDERGGDVAVIAVNGRMVDQPVVARARKIIKSEN